METYTKPHLSYEKQLALLVSRGLACDDEQGALALLRSIGYYRFSAYVYPFRQMLPEDKQCVASPVQYRASSIMAGTAFRDVEELWRFDRRLRMRILDGLELVEIGLRTQLAHVLGRRDPIGHLNRGALDGDSCDVRRPGDDSDQFEAWAKRYSELQSNAKSEDFVRHHLVKYGKPLPIWVAVEFLDFGAIVRLYGLLDKADQNEVARELGVRGGKLLAKWLKALNYLRNTSAHHNRVWNRTLTYATRTPNPNQVDESLRHIASTPVRDKVYLPLAVMAYLIQHIDPSNRWAIHLRDDVKKFPKVSSLSPVGDMGFPNDWLDLQLWAVRPAS